jgi:hypothetical protein
MRPSAAALRSSRPNASAPGEIVSPAERMPTNADAHRTTVTSAARSAVETRGRAGCSWAASMAGSLRAGSFVGERNERRLFFVRRPR